MEGIKSVEEILKYKEFRGRLGQRKEVKITEGFFKKSIDVARSEKEDVLKRKVFSLQPLNFSNSLKENKISPYLQ